MRAKANTKSLFGDESKEANKPAVWELESAAVDAAKQAVRKQFRGHMDVSDREELSNILALRLLNSGRLDSFRYGGKHKLINYAYVSATFALTDLIRDVKARKADEDCAFMRKYVMGATERESAWDLVTKAAMRVVMEDKPSANALHDLDNAMKRFYDDAGEPQTVSLESIKAASWMAAKQDDE